MEWTVSLLDQKWNVSVVTGDSLVNTKVVDVIKEEIDQCILAISQPHG